MGSSSLFNLEIEPDMCGAFQKSRFSKLFFGDLDFSSVCNLSNFFADSKVLKEIKFGSNFDTSHVVSFQGFLKNCSALKELDFGSNFDSSEASSFSYMFSGCNELKSIDFGFSLSTVSCQYMDYMFSHCCKLKELRFGPEFDTSKVISFVSAFAGCYSLSSIREPIDLSGVLSPVNVSKMFSGCDMLTDCKLVNVPSFIEPKHLGLTQLKFNKFVIGEHPFKTIDKGVDKKKEKSSKKSFFKKKSSKSLNLEL